jgi:hypothetical protein
MAGTANGHTDGQLAPRDTMFLNSLTAIGPYMAHRFSWASFKVDSFSNFSIDYV